MPAQPAKAQVCKEKQRLSDELLEAASALTVIQTEQTRNLISGAEGLGRVELALDAARAKWNSAREAYLNHVREHGC